MGAGAPGLRLDLVPSISDGHKGRENAIVPAHFLFRHEHVRWPACLANCHEALSYLWSWGWPEEKGEITAADVERPKNRNGNLHLAVAYKFSVNGDGSYTGESFWTPALATKRRVLAARHKIRLGHPVDVRYTADDPSVNRLDRDAWKSRNERSYLWLTPKHQFRQFWRYRSVTVVLVPPSVSYFQVIKG